MYVILFWTRVEIFVDDDVIIVTSSVYRTQSTRVLYFTHQ